MSSLLPVPADRFPQQTGCPSEDREDIPVFADQLHRWTLGNRRLFYRFFSRFMIVAPIEFRYMLGCPSSRIIIVGTNSRFLHFRVSERKVLPWHLAKKNGSILFLLWRINPAARASIYPQFPPASGVQEFPWPLHYTASRFDSFLGGGRKQNRLSLPDTSALNGFLLYAYREEMHTGSTGFILANEHGIMVVSTPRRGYRLGSRLQSPCGRFHAFRKVSRCSAVAFRYRRRTNLLHHCSGRGGGGT